MSPLKTLLQAVCMVATLGLMPLTAAAAETDVAFGGLKADTSLPVEVQADQLTVSQTDGTAVFSGNVIVTQGDMKLTAAEVKVEYEAGGKGIASLHATGVVALAAGTDTAQADAADYTIATAEVILTGNVLLTQGQATIQGGKLTVNLKTGLGHMEGRVTTIFTPGGN